MSLHKPHADKQGFLNDYARLAGLNTITGGAGADVLTGGGGADTFVYSAFAQGGNVVAGNSITTLTAGDVIVDFATAVDKINIAAVATGTDAAGNGTGNVENFDTSLNMGVGVVIIDYDFSANNLAGNVIDAIIAGYNGGVVINTGDTAYFAILDAGGAGSGDDFYNMFAITNNTGLALANNGLKNAGVDVTLVASTSAGQIIVASDFIL